VAGGRWLAGMPRPLRPVERGLIYHVINRGHNRQRVFTTDADFAAILAALARSQRAQAVRSVRLLLAWKSFPPVAAARRSVDQPRHAPLVARGRVVSSFARAAQVHSIDDNHRESAIRCGPLGVDVP
jgi:hypothetical protein